MVKFRRDEQILRAAAHVIEERGYHGASMQDIADACGIQKASLYHWFRSKEEILERILERSIEDITPGLETVASSDLAPLEKLDRAIRHHVVALCEDMPYSFVLLQEYRSLTDKNREWHRQSRHAYTELLRRILREGVERGDFRPLPVNLTSFAILGMLNWVHQWYSPRGSASPETIADTFADLIVAAVRASPE